MWNNLEQIQNKNKSGTDKLSTHWSSAIKYSSDFRKNPCAWSPKLIYPWSIINYPGSMLLIFNWFASLTPNIFLPPTRSLVFWYFHRYSAIRSSSDFRNFPLCLHSTIERLLIDPSKIDRPPINHQSPWSSSVGCQSSNPYHCY